MKFADPKKLALICALLIGVFFLIVVILFKSLLSFNHVYVILFTTILLMIFSFLAVRLVLNRFIYDRIRLIYKAIHQFKREKGESGVKFLVKKDTVDNVYKEVVQWQQSKSQEIEQLKKMENHRREFLGNVSHELKTPIFNIQGYVLTLLDGGLEDKKINREYLYRTEKSINRMIAIVEDLEEISKLESGELKINYEKIDIVALTKEIMEFMEMKSRTNKAHIYLSSNYDRPIFVYADNEKIRQILINLIDNAIKYGNKEETKIKISFFDMDENILIEITDNGIGIDEDDLSRVFERFYRVDKNRSRETGGTGLGLSIVKHIIEAHNQVINARSKKGVGTTFGFTLKNASK